MLSQVKEQSPILPQLLPKTHDSQLWAHTVAEHTHMDRINAYKKSSIIVWGQVCWQCPGTPSVCIANVLFNSTTAEIDNDDPSQQYCLLMFSEN